MRLAPQTLFGRMVLILLGSLVVVISFSAGIHLRERGKLLFRAGAMQSAQRIADRVQMLDSLDEREQKHFLGALNGGDLPVALDTPPRAESGDPLLEPVADFSRFLRGHFAAERPVRIAVMPSNSGSTSLAWQGDLIGQRFVPPDLALHVQVRLQNGHWASFDLALPQRAFVWPYHLFVNLLILLVVVLVSTLIAVRLATRPLQVLAAAAEDLGKNIHHPPLDENGPAEVRRAAHAFNTMQNRLVRYIQDRTRILAAMSHDLKTPITRLRLRAELLDDGDIKAKFDKDLQEMEAMVTATLDFMRGMERQEATQQVDIMALLESIQADGEEMGRKIHLQGSAERPFPGAPAALKRCLGNLIDNAVKYGTSADISVSGNEKHLEIRIRDRGPGIPEEQLERVFEPFFRLEESRSRDTGGTGLGLSIARNIAQAHGGELVLRNHPDGGIEAILGLPRPA
ncbi:MAG: HAMP domain-containing protein [Sulfuricella sp.]|nr:HAMP domain-containing protein [Sulfuricella sp.]